MTLARVSLLLLLCTGSVHAQQLSHSLGPRTSGRGDALSAPRAFIAVPETIKVLAVMVQFQQDNDTRTTGNGQFVLTAPSDSIIDAPPRNRQYFRDHLTFVENYYRKVSKRKTLVQATVVDSVFTLPAVHALTT